MVNFTNLITGAIVGLFLLLIFVQILGALDPTLSAELNNTDAHPNGPLTLTIIAFFGLAVAIRILLSLFEEGKRQVSSFRREE